MISVKHINAVLSGFLLCGLLFCSKSAAQQAEPTSGNNENRAGEPIQEIVVTGSRIPRRTSELPTPTTVIDAGIFERAGTANLGDVMHEYPALIDGIGFVSWSSPRGDILPENTNFRKPGSNRG